MPSRRNPAPLVLALSLLFSTASLPGAGQPKSQDTTVREEARVTLVEVPVNVVDKNGRPIENLTAEDFEIYDDGKKQRITGFEVIDGRKPLPPPAPGEPPVNPAARRQFLILFDLSFGSPKAVVNARRAARDFVVNRLKDLDSAAVATFSVEQGIRLLVTFTSDRAQLASAIDTLGFPTLSDRTPDPLGLVMVPPSQSNASGFEYITGAATATNGADQAFADLLENLEVNRARSFRAIYRDRVTRLLKALQQLAVSLDSVKGRKHILYLSEGFDSRELAGSTRDGGGAKEANWAIQGQSWKIDSDTRWGNSTLQTSMENALSFFNRSDCLIHAVDIGGLRAGSEITGADQSVEGQTSLYYMAEETGGQFLRNSNDLSDSFEKLLDRTGLIYLLAFQPVRVPENGKFHTLKVTVKNKSWRVSNRSGYYEPKSEKTLTPTERRLAMAQAVTASLPRTDIPTWVLAAPLPVNDGFSRVPVIVEIPGDRLLRNHESPAMNVDIFVYAIDQKGQTRDYLMQPIGIELSKAEQTLAKGGIKYYGQLNLAPGDYTLRTLVRNNETGRFGVSVTPVKVPVGSEPVALPPLFLEESRQWIMVKGKPRSAADAAAEYPFAISGDSFVPTALAGIRNGATTQVCLIAYNFPAGDDSIEYAGRILGVDGKPHGKVDLKLVKASNREREGARKLLLEFRPTGLDPGRYALVLKLQDPATGKAAETKSTFDVSQ